MGFFSIKWKVSIVFAGVAVVVLVAFSSVVSGIFEKDKLAFIFESQQSQSRAIGSNLRTLVEQGLFVSKIAAADYDFEHQELSEGGRRLMESQNNIMAIILRHPIQKNVLARVQHESMKTDYIPLDQPYASRARVSVRDSGLIEIAFPVQVRQIWMQAFTVLDIRKTIPMNSGSSAFGIYQSSGSLYLGEKANASWAPILLGRLRGPASHHIDTAVRYQNQGADYILTRSPTGVDGVDIVSIVESQFAMKALKALRLRSTVLIFFSASLIVLIAILFSVGLTKNLEILKGAAELIAQGQFSASIPVKSRDETGILARAFARMSAEIRRLLIETKEKERLESEIKTARLVQESLFPKIKSADIGGFRIHGTSLSSTECSGDWWYYWQTEAYLYVVIGDATGHGTPAALATAAARSVFSRTERYADPLETIMRDWDFAVSSCSEAKVFMTGILVQIDLKTGAAKAVNSSHELPIMLRREGKVGYKSEFLALETNPTLGEKSSTPWKCGDFSFAGGDYLMLFTDGLLSLEDPKGRTLGERRLCKSLEKKALGSLDAGHLSNQVEALVRDFRGECPLPDDVTFILIERRESAVAPAA